MTTYGLKTGRPGSTTAEDLAGKVSHSLAAAENDVLVGAPSPFGTWVKKTLTEFKTILGITENAVGWSRTGGTTPKTLTVPSNVTLPTITAGGIPYGSATDVWANLAKGTANLKLFIDAGATAPEWAAGIFAGTFSRDVSTATGTQAITGVGFLPRLIFFLSSVSGTVQTSIGFDDSGTYRYCIFNDNAIAAGTWSPYSTKSILLQPASGSYNEGYISTLGSDGFTVTWTKTGTPTGTATIFYVALR